MKTYRYSVVGTDARGVGFAIRGEVQSSEPILSPEVFEAAARDCFLKLTSGKAEYGKPGVGGCRGPYNIARMTIEGATDNGTVQTMHEREDPEDSVL